MSRIPLRSNLQTIQDCIRPGKKALAWIAVSVLVLAIATPALSAQSPSFVGVSTADTGKNGATGLSIPVPSGSVGDLLVAVMGVKNNPSTSSPSGWTAVSGFDGFNGSTCASDGEGIACQLNAYYKTATAASEGSVSFSWGTTYQAAGAVLRYSAATIVAAGDSTSSGTTPTAPSVSAPDDSRILRISLGEADDQQIDVNPPGSVLFSAVPTTERFNIFSFPPFADDNTNGCGPPLAGCSFQIDGVGLAGSDSAQASAGATGTAAFGLFEADETVSATFVIAGNSPPTANDDSGTGFITDEDTAFNTADVLSNDTDPDGDTLSVSALDDGSTIGLVSDNGDGTFNYDPNGQFESLAVGESTTDSIGYTASDGNGGTDTATVTITIDGVNDAPTANDDSGVGFETNEDTSFMTGNVLSNDTDPDTSDILSVSDFDTTGTVGLVTDNGDGTFNYNPNGQFEWLGAGEFTTDSFGYTVSDGNSGTDTATVTIKVTGVNDIPVLTSVSPAAQTIDYSDWISTVTITATDVDSSSLTLSMSGAPSALSLSSATCSPWGVNGTSCSWTMTGQVLDPAAVYTISFTANDGLANSAANPVYDHTLTVLAELATVTFDSNNPIGVQVASPGGDSGPFTLTVYVEETEPDLPNDGSEDYGDISLAVVTAELIPLAQGGPQAGVCTQVGVDGTGYDQILEVDCVFDGVPVNTYSAQATVTGGYYAGFGEDVLVVFDPSLGFTTGGGWFYWPGTEAVFENEYGEEIEYPGDRTNFGFSMKYNKKGNRPKGSLLLIRHLPDGSKYRVKSNALLGLALSPSDALFGWASFIGKSTYSEPGWLEPEGNHTFLAYVEDHGEPGSQEIDPDRFWLEIRDKDDVLIGLTSLPWPADANALDIVGGNIQVPHNPGEKKE